MRIQETITVYAPPAVVWRTFAALEDWHRWNDVCEDCCLLGAERLEAGACLSFRLRPFRLPLKISPRVVRCEPPHEIVWTGGRLGIRATHRFGFTARGDAVEVESEEIFSGPLLWLAAATGLTGRLHRLTRRLMAQLKAQAERCAGEQP